MAPLPEDFSYDHYSAVYNALSFGPLVSCCDGLMGKLTACRTSKKGETWSNSEVTGARSVRAVWRPRFAIEFLQASVQFASGSLRRLEVGSPEVSPAWGAR